MWPEMKLSWHLPFKLPALGQESVLKLNSVQLHPIVLGPSNIDRTASRVPYPPIARQEACPSSLSRTHDEVRP